MSSLETVVRARLDAKGWTLGDLAVRSGLSTAGLRKILRGQVADPRGPTVARLGKALGVSAQRCRDLIETASAAAQST